jgi:hypothetical protein
MAILPNKRFKRISCGILILLIALLIFGIWANGRKANFKPISYFSIAAGMTKNEVHDAMEIPPGRYGHPDVPIKLLTTQNPALERWVNDECVILVFYDQNDCVCETLVTYDQSDLHSFWAPIRRMLRAARHGLTFD